MCKESIKDTVENFSNNLKNNILKKENGFDQHHSELLDLAYAELIQLNARLKEYNSGDIGREEVISQALELASLAVLIVDGTK